MRHRLTVPPKPVARELLAWSNIGSRYWTLRFEDLPDKAPEKAQLLSYVANMHRTEATGCGLLLTGPPGRGKTASLSILLREAMARGPIKTYFVMAAEIDRFYKNTELKTHSGASVWDRLLTSQFIAIDDVGHEDHTEWKLPSIELLVRARLNNQLVTYISSNHDERELFKKFGWLRSVSKDLYDLIEMKGEDLRV